MQGITIFMRLVGGQQVARQARDVETSVDGVGKAADRLKVAAGAGFLALGTALGAGLTTGIQYQAQIEQLEVSFGTLLDSQQRAAEYVDYLQRKGAATPFEMSDLAQASQTLLGFNYSLSETKGLIDSLGNTSSALGRGPEGLQQLALIFGQIRAKGRLQGDEVLQLAENGLAAGEIIRKQLGMSKDDFRVALEQGKIDSDTAITTLTRYMDRKFRGAMDRQSRTLGGQWSTFNDNLKQTLGSLAAPGAEWLKKTGLPEANKLLKDLPGYLSDIRGDVGPAADGMSSFATALADAAEAGKPFFDNVVKPFSEGAFGQFIKQVGDQFKTAGAGIEFFGDALGLVGEGSGASKALGAIKQFGEGVASVLGGPVAITKNMIDNLRELGILDPTADGTVTNPDQARDVLSRGRTTKRPAPLAPSKEAPKAPTKKKSPNPLNVPNVLDRGMGRDINITVPVNVDNRKIGEANARARADEKARR